MANKKTKAKKTKSVTARTKDSLKKKGRKTTKNRRGNTII